MNHFIKSTCEMGIPHQEPQSGNFGALNICVNILTSTNSEIIALSLSVIPGCISKAGKGGNHINSMFDWV